MGGGGECTVSSDDQQGAPSGSNDVLKQLLLNIILGQVGASPGLGGSYAEGRFGSSNLQSRTRLTSRIKDHVWYGRRDGYIR